MSHLILICVGDEYINILKEKIYTIAHNEYTKIHILTNDLSKVNKIKTNTMFYEKISLYYRDEKDFNYFHKFYFTFKLAIKLKETVKYVDIKRTELLLRFIPKKGKEGIHYISPWGPNLINASLLENYGCEYFEKGYWNSFIKKLKNLNVDPKKIIPLTEQLLVVNFDEKLSLLLDKLKALEIDFIEYSRKTKSVYKKLANGEGLALGYACYELNIPLHLLNKHLI